MSYDTKRYSVVRYPDGYAVIDKQDNNRIVFGAGTRAAAHVKARNLNKEGTST